MKAQKPFLWGILRVLLVLMLCKPNLPNQTICPTIQTISLRSSRSTLLLEGCDETVSCITVYIVKYHLKKASVNRKHIYLQDHTEIWTTLDGSRYSKTRSTEPRSYRCEKNMSLLHEILLNLQKNHQNVFPLVIKTVNFGTTKRSSGQKNEKTFHFLYTFSLDLGYRFYRDFVFLS